MTRFILHLTLLILMVPFIAGFVHALGQLGALLGSVAR